MTFSSTITGRSVLGNKRFAWGTFDAASVTGGDIVTGLEIVEFIAVQAGGSSVVADAPTVNETLPVDGAAITIIVTTSATGYWWAWGR